MSKVEVDVAELIQWGGSLVAVVLALYLTKCFYKWFFVPLNFIHGKPHQGLEYRKEDDKQNVYPNGWFVLIDSRSVKKQQVREIQFCGQDLIVWRGKSGQCYVADAYCPHLGAHLACGSHVKGECVQCPFHGWTFSGTEQGKCVSIMGTDSIPGNSGLKMKRHLERNGFIYVWFHMEDAEPHWEPEELPELASGEYKYCGRAEFYLNCFVQDISENFGDANHLPSVHSPTYLWWEKMHGPDWATWILPCKWWSTYEYSTTPTSYLDLRSDVGLFNWTFMLYQVFSRGTAEGPGMSRYRFNILHNGWAHLFVCVTPMGSPNHCRLIQLFYCSPNYPMWVGKGIFLAETIQIARDEVIWNGKRHIKKEMLIKEDKGLKQYKQWYKQFWQNNNNRSNEDKAKEDLTF